MADCMTSKSIHLQGGLSCLQTSRHERSRTRLASTSAKRFAKGLGWFSIGLGLTELLAPRAIASISGVSNRRTGLIRLYGLREIAAGVAIFSQKKPTEGVWSRVAGDALDLASLGVAATSPDAKRGKRCFRDCERTGSHCARRHLRDATEHGNIHGIHAKGTCIVNRPPEEVYSSGVTSKTCRASCDISIRSTTWATAARAGKRKDPRAWKWNGMRRSSPTCPAK